ncbi:SRPBCC family protein [Caulobacter hibisci]|uniref:SRPBCC family protein n=1 Tax=Caulobacter hibisci TaxID=2035993 RepID=A0ABS0SV14_9CAUL|nr:SRPBCC family protein [Caulobacter hibisci]MBI1683487.1 SRPBCC family protein [Caulobacter hibisci]
MKLAAPVFAVLTLLAAGGARAEVVDAQPNGFETRRAVVIAKPAAEVWAALVQPSKWWNSSHTWSGSAANLSLGAASGACFCEKMPNGGSVLHMTTVNAQPGKQLTLFGGLGPLQMSGASGHLVWALAEADGRTTLTWTYDVGGYRKGGLDKIAPAVDQVLAEQQDRLKAYVETGKAG